MGICWYCYVRHINIIWDRYRISKVLGVYVIAALAGVVSLVPGGLGSFDLVFFNWTWTIRH